MEKENVKIAGTEKVKKRRPLLNLKKLEEAAKLPVTNTNQGEIACEYTGAKNVTRRMFEFEVFTDSEGNEIKARNGLTTYDDGGIRVAKKSKRQPPVSRSIIEEKVRKAFLPESFNAPGISKTPSTPQ